jgi:hypothetical protein
MVGKQGDQITRNVQL